MATREEGVAWVRLRGPLDRGGAPVRKHLDGQDFDGPVVPVLPWMRKIQLHPSFGDRKQDLPEPAVAQIFGQAPHLE